MHSTGVFAAVPFFRCINKMNFTDIKGLFPVTWNEVSAAWYTITVEIERVQETIENYSSVNAASLLGRILFTMEEGLEYVLSELESTSSGGEVPTVASMLVGLAEEDESLLSSLLAKIQRELTEEYKGSQEEIYIRMQKEEPQALPALHPVDLQKMVFYLIQLPEGIQKMSDLIQGQADTFCNLIKLNLLPDGLHFSVYVGSRVESSGKLLTDKICYLTEFLGGDVDFDVEEFSW